MVPIPMIKEKKTSPSHNSNFFPIPKLTCLVQNFSIPEPVIHPPGSDPYQFLNPNPHRNAGFKPMDPMNLDPCVVASRFEIVTKTTDLTASEHAGVNLGECTTTIVSTAISESPAHSEVITQQAMNDVVVTTSKSDVVVTKIENDNVVTKTESVVVIEIESDVEERKIKSDVVATKAGSKNGKSIICDVCKVTCNSQRVFKRHKEGKIHLKNMRKVLVSSVIKQETSPLVVNGVLDKESDKKKDMLQNAISVNSFYCSIPALGSDNQMIESTATEQVINPLCMDQLPNPTCVSTTAVHHSNGRTLKVDGELNKCLDRHNSGKQNLKDSEHIVVPSSATPIISMQTTPIYKHVDNLKSIESNFGGSQVLWCKVCKVSCTTSNDLNKHVSGKKHLKNLNKLPKIPNLPLAVIPPMTKPVTKGEVVDPNEVSSLQCKLCGICCNSCDVLNKHKSGKKHQKKLKKLEQLFEQIPADKPSLYDNSRNVESKVVILDSSKRKANGSLSSEENGDAKKQKMMEEEVGSDVSMIACNVCNVVCTGIMALKFHLLSKKHTTMALKQVNACMK